MTRSSRRMASQASTNSNSRTDAGASQTQFNNSSGCWSQPLEGNVMGRYNIHESVGTKVQPVHSYEDLEIHHPSKRGHEPGRAYGTFDGEREEILRNRTSADNRMVSKDF